MGAHGAFDLIRDIVSGLVVGLLLMVISRYRSHRLATKRRLDRHGVEIRHTQKETKVEPFYKDSENEL